MPKFLMIENRAGQPAPDPEPAGVPQSWDAAAAMLAETMAVRFEALERDRAEERAGMLRQMEDLAGLVRQLTDRRGEDLRAVAAQTERADGLARQLADLQAVLDDQAGKILALNQALDATDKRADRFQASLLTIGEQIDSYKDQTIQALEDARGVAANLVKGVHDRLADLAPRLAELEAGRTVDAAAALARADDLARQVDQINGRVGEVVLDMSQTAETAGEMVDEIQKAVIAAAGAVEQVARISARANELLNQVPAGFMINQTGKLVRISAGGEAVEIGPVVGRDGVDGRDGADGRDGVPAAKIVAAAIEGNRLRIIQSDGAELQCDFQAPIAVTPKAEPGPNVEDMQKMRAKGDTLAVIGKKHGVSGSYVSRLLKKAEQDGRK